MITIRRRLFAAGLLALMAVGCAQPVRSVPPRPAEPPAPSAQIGLEVVNHSWDLIEVRAIVDGLRLFVGEVGSERAATFQLPTIANEAWRLRLAVASFGQGDEFTSEPIHASPGQVIDLVVNNVIARSRINVRDGDASEPVSPRPTVDDDR